ncbi:ATP-binding protein [Paucibacter sp. R3-3]|uniref:histidine kinase n=1 Tax=Roseateles agri TaxID=3098619 RepID=A0ABU5DHR9_9BURK|nr:ATP-binding protein [Paucibacter sp. R3-3]MDY0744672.1 ATP-binding protein [Paucibacter sp. R3-3]
MAGTFARRWLPPLLIWVAAGALMRWVDGQSELAHIGNLALLLVLAAALSSRWLPLGWALAVDLLAVLAFNAAFIEPRGSFLVELRLHAWLLATMLAISWSTAGLMARLRQQAELAGRHAREAERLRVFSEALRDAGDAAAQADALREALQDLAGTPARLLVLKDALPRSDDDTAALPLDPALSADQRTGLWLSARRSLAFGPGTGRHEELPEWYLPLRGRAGSGGAALIAVPAGALSPDPALRAQAQLLCDQLGLALERSATERAAQQARDAVDQQGLRNALLAAISHDYRTPLATIMGAASALQEQDERLSPAQRRKLAAAIVDESQALARMTDNTLQIARLDAPGVTLKTDWESAEELVGAALRRVRQRHPEARVRARLDDGLPLLRCDAVLLLQLLDNLLDNALKYGGEGGAEIRVTQCDGLLTLAVRDRGPGVPPAWRERIFDVFQRGSAVADPERPDAATRRGAGVGLAACRAIARAHGGELRYRARSHGGASFECRLPLPAPNELPMT